ncbi:unannotated protein [freshwater metagenome]|uniref:Unannotated protein n=1 Tax=freshwater metagenome TaxID=449393 RepID=A0A6J6DU38_9ZZZZ
MVARVLGPSGQRHPADHARARVTTLDLVPAQLGFATERREVVLPHQRVAAQTHQVQVHGRRHVPHRGGEEGVGRGIVQDRVAVPTPQRREPGIEGGIAGPGCGAHHDARRAHLGESARQRLDLDVAGEVATDHLIPRVHSGVGASGPGDLHRSAHDQRERRGQIARHGPHALVHGETVELRSVVGHRQTSPPGGGLVHVHSVVLVCGRRASRRRPIRRVRCAPWGRCRPDAVRA